MQCCAPSDPSSTNQEQSSLFPARATHEPLPWPGSRGCTIMRRATCLSRLKSGDVEAAGGVLQPHAPPSAAGVKRARCEYALPQSPQSSDKDRHKIHRHRDNTLGPFYRTLEHKWLLIGLASRISAQTASCNCKNFEVLRDLSSVFHPSTLSLSAPSSPHFSNNSRLFFGNHFRSKAILLSHKRWFPTEQRGPAC